MNRYLVNSSVPEVNSKYLVTEVVQFTSNVVLFFILEKKKTLVSIFHLHHSMDGGNEERREETVGLVVIVVFAVLAVCSLLVACCYYCYIRFKLSQHLKTKSLNGMSQSQSHNPILFSFFLSFYFSVVDETAADEESADAVAAAADERENETKRPHTATAMGAPTGEKVGVVVFPFKQLHIATGGFGKGNAIGHGSFGSVYKGVLGDGRKIAVKLMDHAGKQGEEEFKMEVRV